MRKLTKEKRRKHMLRDSIMHTVEEDEGGDGSANVRITRNKISRQASIGTATVLKQMPSTPRPAGFSLELPTRVVAVFREPLRSEHTEYLGSSQFADDILNLARQAGRRFEREPSKATGTAVANQARKATGRTADSTRTTARRNGSTTKLAS